ncbi:MAG: TetR/AcrR family transcriptional regulator [Acidimicrobiia bacterium]|nr:TetR/AcrR family transcriptional regulator [Acidimicrobiia bacterium]
MSDSREVLLEAAWHLVVESFGFEPTNREPGRRVGAKILEQLKAADIAARADMTTGAFYNRWPNREAFLADFLDYALSVERSPTFEAVAVAYAEVKDLPFLEQIERLAVVNLEAIVANPSFAIQTHLWSLMRSRPDIRDRMGAMYRDFRDPMIPIYESMLVGLGRRLREPLTMPQLSDIMVALSEGMTMQIVVGGGFAPTAEVFSLALQALLPVLTAPSGDERSIQQVVVEELASTR